MKPTRTFNHSIDQNGFQFKEPHIKLVVCCRQIRARRQERQRFAVLKTISIAERKLNDSCFVTEELYTIALDKHFNVYKTTPVYILILILYKLNRRKSIVQH